MLLTRHKKWQATSKWRNRTTQSRQDQNALRKRDLQMHRNLGGWHHQTSRKKDKIQTEYLRRTRKLLVTNLPGRNFIKGITIWAVPVVGYLGPFLKLTRDELGKLDQRSRKLMTIHKALHSRDDVERLYLPRKEGGRELLASKTALTHPYNDSKTTLKNTNEDWSWPSETTLTTR